MKFQSIADGFRGKCSLSHFTVTADHMASVLSLANVAVKTMRHIVIKNRRENFAASRYCSSGCRD